MSNLIANPPSRALPSQRMDDSDSPTQLNDDRSYTRHQDSGQSQSIERGPSGNPSGSPDPAILNESDTELLDFGSNVGIGGHGAESFPTEDSELVDFSALSPFVTDSPADESRSRMGLLPETPAPPKNPFASNDGALLLGGSQLFRHTQFSSVPRRLSPTSSRPSPNGFPGQGISPNPVISSPLKPRRSRSSLILEHISSPEIPDTSSQPQYGAITPFNNASEIGRRLVSESPHVAPRRRKVRGPSTEYEPMKKSQERRQLSVVHSLPDSSDDDDDDVDRRQRARRKQEEATRQLSTIRLHPSSFSENVEVPSTTMKQKKPHAEAEKNVVQPWGGSPSCSIGRETVADSQEVASKRRERGSYSNHGIELSGEVRDERAVPLSATPTGASSDPTGRRVTRHARAKSREAFQVDPYASEAIPETSPAGRHHPKASNVTSDRASFPALSGDLPPDDSPLNNSQGSSVARLSQIAFQAGPHASLRSSDRNLAQSKLDSLREIPNTSSTNPTAQPIAESPPRVSTQGQERAATSNPTPAGSSSELSSLQTTPVLSNGTTPATEESGRSELGSSAAAVNQFSPAVAKIRRREALETLPKLNMLSAAAGASTRASRHRAHRCSGSTDELADSPAVSPTFEQGLQVPKMSASRIGRKHVKAAPASRESSLRGGKIFEGMVFAISFQSKRPGEGSDQFAERMEYAKAVEKRIQQAGGRVLANGFDELFNKSSITSAATSPSASSQPGPDLSLLPSEASTGFTALIADGHSRKVKYMQALALGLPCIAPRWVTTCVESDRLVDWDPYLLCAGQSSFLGGAIRSRNLAPYNSATAKLTDVLGDRPRFLEGSNVLLVMKRADEGKKMAYVFLAHVLGASLSRVYSVDEARTKLKAMEALDRPYDWVYVDDKSHPKLIFTDLGGAENKKRKRRSGSTIADSAPKRIRTLSNEVVIQSLILGKLIDEDIEEGVV